MAIQRVAEADSRMGREANWRQSNRYAQTGRVHVRGSLKVTQP